jgi:4-hydroxy-4-methyl-2-oxoglutarate aldolase
MSSDGSHTTTDDDEDVVRLGGLPVALVADVLDRMDLRRQVMSPAIRLVSGRGIIVARASTVQGVASAELPENPYEHELSAIDAVTHGSVVVVSTGGVYDAAIWGELLATRATHRGAVGAVIDGGVRDTVALEKMGFTVFAASVSPNDSFGRVQVTESQRPVICGGVAVRAGDIVLADRDGVVVVPAEVTSDVAEAAAAKRRKEAVALAELAAGASASDVYARHGVL